MTGGSVPRLTADFRLERDVRAENSSSPPEHPAPALVLGQTRDAASAATNPVPSVASAGGGQLVVADLSGMALNRRLVSKVATTLARFATRGRTSGQVSLLLYAPFSDGSTIAVPAGTRFLDASAFIDVARRDRANEWAYRASLELADGVGRCLFPTIDGVHFGALNLMWVQTFLRDYAMLTEALKAFGEDARGTTVAHCTVVSGNADVARALAVTARAFAATARAWHPPERLHAAASRAARLVRRERARPPQPPVPANAGGALVVSDSPPMRAMFDVMDARFADLSVRPVTRLDYVQRANEAAVRSGAMIARVAPTAAECPRAARREIEKYRDIVRRAASAANDAPSAPVHAFLSTTPVAQFLGQLSAGSFEEQAAQLRETRAIITTTRPDVVVVGNDRWWFGQAFVRVARQSGIPTVSLQDGLEGAHPHWFWATADVVATSGSMYPDYLTSHGTDASRVHVVGQPRYDRLVAAALKGSSVERRAAARERLGIPHDWYCVLFAAQTEQDPSYARQVTDAVLAVPGVHLVVRPHPSSRLEPYTELFANHPSGRVTLQASGDSFDVLNVADAVVLQHSTVAVEAAILGRAVITANFSGLPDVVPYADLGLSMRANSAARVTETVAMLAHMTDAERTALLHDATMGLERLIGPQDGKASLRAATLIAEVLGANHSGAAR